MDYQYLTVKQMSEKYPVFTEGGLRHLIFHEHYNGFSHCLVRIGRRVLIDERCFLEWLDSQRSHQS